MISKHSRIVAADHISIVDIGGESVVLNLNAGQYFGLNQVGTRILELLQKPVQISDVVTILQSDYDYDVARDQIENDVIEFVDGLRRNEIVQIVTGGASDTNLVADR